jgi:hypothetical protein
MTRERFLGRASLGAFTLAALLAGAAVAEERRHPLLPDHAKVQFAGAVGLVSAGTGYAFGGRRLELDAFLGWVPESLAGTDLFTLTGKITWLPWSARLARGWRLRPITAALAMSYTFGDRFFVVLPEKYPRGYYPLPTALRGTVALGGTIGRPAPPFAEVALYWELVAVDLPLALWIQNPGTVSAADVVSLALGLRASF